MSSNNQSESITTSLSDLTPAELQVVAEPVLDEMSSQGQSDNDETETNEVNTENSSDGFASSELENGGVETSEADINNAEMPISLTAEQMALVADNGEVDEEGFIKVEMKFENDCWVEVYDVNEERIAIGNKPAGYLMTLNAQGPFNVLLGNPVGVSIWVNGEPYDMSDLPRNRVARFELDLPMAASSQAVQ